MIDRAGRLAKRYSLYRLMTADSPVWTRFNDGHRCEQHGVLRVVSSRHTHFIRHGIRRDQMSLLQSNVNTTRYFADAPEAVGKTDESAPGDLLPPPPKPPGMFTTSHFGLPTLSVLHRTSWLKQYREM